MGAYNGWERANWFAKAGDDISLESTHTWSRNGEAVSDNPIFRVSV